MRKIILMLGLFVFLFSLASASFNEDYTYKKNITLNQSQLVESITDFPLLVNIYDQDLKNYALANGNDILFAIDDYNKLDFQIEIFNQSYNSTHANLIAWVKINVTNASNNIIWIYFNNTNATNQESRNVWSNSYKGVYHLSENSGTIFDAGLFSHNSTTIGGTPDYSQTGKIGKSINFASASNEYINFGDVNDYDFTGEYSISAWFKTTQNAQYAGICGKLTTSPAYGYALQVHLGNSQIWIGNGSYSAPSGNAVNDNNWHHFYLVRNGANHSFYIDGIYRNSFVANGTVASTSGFYIGSWGDVTYDFNGLVDEVQLANKSRSTGFITTSFRNQNNTNAFYSVGSLTLTDSSQSNNIVSFSNFTETPLSSSIYVENQNYTFNVTITGNNFTSWLEFNNVNYSASNYSNVFISLLYNLAAGNYNYRWWTFSNETTSNLTSSSIRSYTINKASPTVNLTLNGSKSNITLYRGDSLIINCSMLAGEDVVSLYNGGNILSSGTHLSNITSFNVSGTYNITCIYSQTQNYSQNIASYFVEVLDLDIDPPIIEFTNPTPASGTISNQNNFAFAFETKENNLNKLIWNFDNFNYSIYDGNLILQTNFENDSDFNESSFNYYDTSLYRNNGTCTNCPNTSISSRFPRDNPNDNNLLFNERFNTDLGNWTSSTYGGEISIVTKDFSNKVLLNDTASFSYISIEREINESFSNYIIEYDLFYSTSSVLVMELFDGQDNLVSSIDVGSATNTLSFDTDTASSTNSTFNSGLYKQIILSIDKTNRTIRAYLSENDATYGSLTFVAAKNYSGSNITKIRFRTGQTETGVAYLDEIRIYKPVMSVIGDSITDGKRLWSTHPAYPEGRLSSITNESSPPQFRIGNLICKNCWIGNRGFGGSTTTSVNTYVQPSLLDQGFEQIYIAIGHNDIAASTALTTMQNNFDLIINKTLTSGINASNIVIANVFPGSDINTVGEIQNKNNWNAWLFNRSQELGAVYVDLDSALRDPASINQIRSTYNSGDGVHLNSAGNEVLALAAVNAIYEYQDSHGFRSLRFDGNNDAINFGNSSLFSSEKISVSIWLNFTSVQNSSILSKSGSYELNILNNKIIAEVTNQIQKISVTANESYNDGLWHNFAFSYNGSMLSLYVDGNLKSINYSSGNINISDTNLILGSNSSSFYNGILDELKIYNLSLSNEEINMMGNSELIKSNSTLWKFYINQTNLVQKTYRYNAMAYDRNFLFGEENYRNLSINYDALSPIISISSPISTTYNDSIFVNYSASDASLINSCWYNLDNGMNITLLGCTTTTLNGLSDGNHTINLYANDSYGNTNRTSVTFTIDSSAPLYITVSETYPQYYSENYSYFNITWSDSSLQNVLFESNFSGNSLNYSMSNMGGGVYQFFGILPAGTFYWIAYANDSYGHYNVSDKREFTILKSSEGARLYLNGQRNNLSLVYGNISNVSVQSVSGDYQLLRNGEMVVSPESKTLAAGYYNYTLDFFANQNYTDNTITLFINVTKANPSFSLLLNGFDSDISVGEGINISIESEVNYPGNIVGNLYEDGILISTGNPIEIIRNYSSTGEHIWNLSIDESENYTFASKTHSIFVLDSNYPSYSNLKVSANSPATYQNSRNYIFNSTWIDNVAIEEVIFEFQNINYSLTDGEIIKNGNEYYFNVTDLAAGSYTYRWYGSDSSNNNVSTPIQMYTVEKAIGALFLSVSPSNSINYGTAMNILCVANNPESSLALTRNSALVSIPDTTILSPGSYNYACTASASQNYTSSSATSTLTVSKATPDIKLYLNDLENNLELSSSGGIVEIFANLTLNDGSEINLTLYINGFEIINFTNYLEYNYTFVSGINNISIFYLGDENYNSRTFTRFVTVAQASQGGGSGGSNNGGGGGSGGSNNGGRSNSDNTKNKSVSLEFQSLGDIIISPGESKILELNVKNDGETFLNKCKLKGTEKFESWIKSDTNKNINPGEITEYIFEMIIPLSANSTDDPRLFLECLEKEFEVPIKTIILNSGMDVEIDSLDLISTSQLRINFTVIGNDDFDENIVFKVYDFEDNLLSEKTKEITIVPGKKDHTLVLDVSKAEKGLLKVELSKKSGAVIVDEFFVYDSQQPITGFAFLDKVGGNSFYIIFVIIFFLIVAFLIMKRMHSVKNINKWDSHNTKATTSKENKEKFVALTAKKNQVKKVEAVKQDTPKETKKVKWSEIFKDKHAHEASKQSTTKLKDEIQNKEFNFQTYGKNNKSGFETY